MSTKLSIYLLFKILILHKVTQLVQKTYLGNVIRWNYILIMVYFLVNTLLLPRLLKTRGDSSDSRIRRDNITFILIITLKPTYKSFRQ